MRALLAALLLSAAFAGCLDDDDAPEAGDESFDDEAPAFVTRTGTTDLGSISGTALTPSRFDFTVVVPPGGATGVRWEMSIDGAAPNNLDNRVEGPGCDGGLGNLNVNVQISVVGSSTFGGSCSDLDAGEHAFTAVLNTPTLDFTAKVMGQATVQYAVEG